MTLYSRDVTSWRFAMATSLPTLRFASRRRWRGHFAAAVDPD
jgi:hypothetical protein